MTKADKFRLQWLVKHGYIEPEEMKGLDDKGLVKLILKIRGMGEHANV